jgi:hypothetical protein
MKYAMADGRIFTNWGPNCDIIKVIQREMNIEDTHKVRKYLQDNAEKIMEKSRKKCDGDICPVCKNFITK